MTLRLSTDPEWGTTSEVSVLRGEVARQLLHPLSWTSRFSADSTNPFEGSTANTPHPVARRAFLLSPSADRSLWTVLIDR
jgi:hypothetical protein